MDKPVTTQNAPIPVEVEADKKYFYCTCGQSKKQPFCDGSHSGTDFRPTLIEVKEAKTIYFCGCRASKKGHFCDGSHKTL